MKLLVMKSVCLLVFLGALFGLGLLMNIEQAWTAYDQCVSYWPKTAEGAPNLFLPGILLGVLAAIAGAYGFLPEISSRKNKYITYRGPHGDIVMELRPIRKVLLKVMRKMPEVYSMKLNVRPDKDGRRACIVADVVLKNSVAQGARSCARMVARCLSATAKDVLGLEELSSVRVNVRGVHVDINTTGRQMREHLAAREEEESKAYAVAHPPVASVTMQVDSTDNTGVAVAEAQPEIDIVDEQREVPVVVTDNSEAPCCECCGPCEAEPCETESEEAPEEALEEALEEVVSVEIVEEPLDAAPEEVQLPPLMEPDPDPRDDAVFADTEEVPVAESIETEHDTKDAPGEPDTSDKDSEGQWR